MIRLLLILGIVVSWSTLCAQANRADDVLAIDSLVVRKTPDGGLFVLCKAGPASTVGSIAILTGSTEAKIQELNPILRFRELEPGDLLIAPLDRRMIETSGSINPPMQSLWYEVQAGETIFSIARRTFDISIDDLMALNGLTGVALRQGQPLHVGWLAAPSKPLPVAESKPAPDSWYYSADTAETGLVADSLDSRHYAKQKGVAWWNKSKPDGNFFALHRQAPLNSYIEITNPMFGRSVRAKVIGTIPPTYPEDISVIVSEGVARQLGAIDTRFYAEMSYALD